MPHFYQKQKRKQPKHPPFLPACVPGLSQTLPWLRRVPQPSKKCKVSKRDVLGFWGLGFSLFIFCKLHGNFLIPCP